MTAPSPPRHAPTTRGVPDLLLLLGGTVLLVLAALPVHRTSISGAETAVFRAVNDLPLPIVVVWPVMQLGNLFVVPAAAAAAAFLYRWRLAGELLLAGLGVWVLAKVVKGLVPRGRPDDLLSDVVIRGGAALGRGFVSGHAAVVSAVLVVAWPWLSRRGRIVCAALAAAVCLARINVGAHLPLDIVGGVGLGVAVGGSVRLLVGRPG